LERGGKLIEIKNGDELGGSGASPENFRGDPNHIHSEHFEIYLGENPLRVNSTKGFTRVKSLTYNPLQDSLLDIRYRNPRESRPLKDIEEIFNSEKRPEGNGIEGELLEIKGLIEKIRARNI